MRGWGAALAAIAICAGAWAEDVATVPYATPCAYPAAALAAHREGETQLSFHKTADGRFGDVAVAKSSGWKDFDAAAIQCVRSWEMSSADAETLKHIDKLYIEWSIPGAAASLPAAGRVRIGKLHHCGAYYPPAEKKAGIEGKTIVAFRISERGRVSNVEVAVSSGNAHLDDAALMCVRRWRYLPARGLQGQAIAVPWKAAVVWQVVVPPPAPEFAAPPLSCAVAYPVTADQLAGIDGVTTLSYVVNGDMPKNIQVQHSSGSRVLDENAIRCVAAWRYKPVTKNGRTVALPVRATISWSKALAAKAAPSPPAE